MRHKLRVLVLGVLAVGASVSAPTGTALAPAAARADDTADERAAAIKTAVDELASADDVVRERAAARLAGLGRTGAAELAKRCADLDDRALKAVADAYVRAGWSGYAYTFFVAARRAPPAHAKRLLDLAHALNPIAGVSRTHEETAAEVHRLLDQAGRARCSTGYAEEIALLGHDALEPLLAGMRDDDPTFPGGSTACNAVNLLAERDDLPAIRQLLLAGRVNLADTMGRMQKEGVREATDALLDAAAAGRLEAQVARALVEASDRDRVRQAVIALVASKPEVAVSHRAALAWLVQRLEAGECVPTIESWIGTTKEPGDIVAISDALVHFGSPKGVGILVRIVSERVTRFPCRPSTPEELAAASAPGRLCPEGFWVGHRERAAQQLSAIAGKDVFDVPEDWSRREQGPNRESENDYLDRAAKAFRTWWDTSKDTLHFDTASGRWTVGG